MYTKEWILLHFWKASLTLLDTKMVSYSLLLASLLAAPAIAQNSTYNNPILPGFHPDPSCIFVPEWDNTFFCASSSFLAFPGIPIHASRDLQKWKLISNALNRPEQLPELNTLIKATSGIWAATIRYQDGLFYLVTTMVHDDQPNNSTTRFVNLIMTSTNPYSSASWSDPVRFGFEGYDTSPFWDDDGQTYITGTFQWQVAPGIQLFPIWILAKWGISPKSGAGQEAKRRKGLTCGRKTAIIT
jgi:beta-xylosidase